MTTPNVFILHRWPYSNNFDNLVSKFEQYGFSYSDYSVPNYDPLNVRSLRKIESALREQIRHCHYFLIFANMAMAHSKCCKYGIDVASEYGKPILSIRPHGYAGKIPVFIQVADTEGCPAGFNTPAIIRKICSRLNHPLP